MLPISFPAFPGWASSVRFQCATNTTGSPSSAPATGSASFPAIHAVDESVDRCFPRSLDSQTSARSPPEPLALVALPAESDTPSVEVALSHSDGSSPYVSGIEPARMSCSGLLPGPFPMNSTWLLFPYVPTPVLLAVWVLSGVRIGRNVGTFFGGRQLLARRECRLFRHTVSRVFFDFS